MDKSNDTQQVKHTINQLITCDIEQGIDDAIETLQMTAERLESLDDPGIKNALRALERCASRLEQHYVKNDMAKARTALYLAAEKGLGVRVRRLREGVGFTQSNLAAMAGTNQAVIQKIENGHSTRPRVLSAIAVALNVNPAWLQFGDGFANKEPLDH
ncbi:helix-turn-helix domain-containing protein [Sedimenticola selenatireducens]|uniref:Helix-turn-helix transcriptional regulator n=2 Tax=Sedimenticola TaxID=349742 RepID=A0A558CLM4_9GAMM|nr:helix-turn-helix transcriptional regulator [Sedimenticola selenatireducens]TVO69679.1 helix-turn-helix transcriptional regulator [Sedimenticola selenatireducens]TVT49690.1 MAG: helix-turn-helix transcriptional regulator [Sedimenticola thiotaurini]TVT62253.1 MAG: helix-turn-helix transcriptional regulator [Sedimenticola selenatireducens]